MSNDRDQILDNLLQRSSGSHDLKRTLGPINLTALGVGAIIGAGIFVMTGTAAANYAGPAIVLSFVLSGLACAFAALCYAEFASMIPIAGSAYTYAYATMGRFFAWIIGWDLILEYLFASSAVAVGWSGYASSFLKGMGIQLPKELLKAPLDYSTTNHAWSWSGSVIDLPAMLVIALITFLLVIGIKESTRFNNIIVVTKLAVILLFIGIGFFFINSVNWDPFIPENTGEFGHYGWSGVMRASGVIFFAYIGFDAVSTAAQESKNPQRDMPIGIMLSLAIATVLYILVALVLTGVVKYTELNVPDPIAVGIDRMNVSWLKPLVKIGAIAGLSSVILVMLMGQPRIFYAMAKDGLLPPAFATIHPVFKTPHITTIASGIFAMLIAGFFPISVLGELVSIGTLFAFLMVCLGVLILRYRRPDIPRPFKTPFMPYVPILGILCCLGQMLALPGDTWLRLIIWMAIGLAIYYLYGKDRKPIDLSVDPEIDKQMTQGGH
jgi:basic amino acid/polyamine antiporter, APA family